MRAALADMALEVAGVTALVIMMPSPLETMEGTIMRTLRRLAAVLLPVIMVCTGASMTTSAECEHIIGRHMVGEALLAAHLVAVAEKAGMKASEINAILKDIAEKSAIQEFWI